MYLINKLFLMYFHMKPKISGSNTPIVTSGPTAGVRFHSLMDLQVKSHNLLSLKPFVTLRPNAGNVVVIAVDGRVYGQ